MNFGEVAGGGIDVYLFIYFLITVVQFFFMKWSWQFIVIHGKSEFRSNATSMVPFTKHRMVLRIPMKKLRDVIIESKWLL